MATISFERDIVITNKKGIDKIKKSLKRKEVKPINIAVKNINELQKDASKIVEIFFHFRS